MPIDLDQHGSCKDIPKDSLQKVQLMPQATFDADHICCEPIFSI